MRGRPDWGEDIEGRRDMPQVGAPQVACFEHCSEFGSKRPIGKNPFDPCDHALLKEQSSRVRTPPAVRLRAGWKRSGERIRPAVARALRHPVRQKRWPSTPRYQRTRSSFAALGEKSGECAGPSLNRSERPPWNGRVNQCAATFEVLQPLVERRLLTLPDRTDFGYWFPSIRDSDGLSFAHLPNDLGESRFRFVDSNM